MESTPSTPVMLLCSCPNKEIAEELAVRCVEQHLAACVNILPGITSVFEWQNKIETALEYLLIIKTIHNHTLALEQLLKENHPYELPEIMQVPIQGGSGDYLQWISTQCHQSCD